VETEALFGMLHCVQSRHDRTKTQVVKSLCVCNIVVHVLQIIVVWLQVIMCEFLFTWCGQTLINFFCFYWCVPDTKSNRNGSKWPEFFEKSTIVWGICCRASCCVMERILCQLVLKNTPRVQAIIHACF